METETEIMFNKEKDHFMIALTSLFLLGISLPILAIIYTALFSINIILPDGIMFALTKIILIAFIIASAFFIISMRKVVVFNKKEEELWKQSFLREECKNRELRKNIIETRVMLYEMLPDKITDISDIFQRNHLD